MRVTHHDNRGTKAQPYGFVYFDDDSRVVYASEIDISPFVGPHWRPATDKHVELARAYLAGAFPGISFDESEKEKAIREGRLKS